MRVYSGILSCAAVVARSVSASNFSSSASFGTTATGATATTGAAAAAFVNRSFASRNVVRQQQQSKASFMSSSDEVQKAQEAAAEVAADGAPPTVFDKILSGEWSSDKIHDDEYCMAFRDISPQAPVHFLVIPKNRDGLTQIRNAREDQKPLLGHLLYVAQLLGQKECPDGFRITINDGKDGAQSVYHLHLHVMGGRQMQWPPG